MSILDEIIAHKRQEVARQREKVPLVQLEARLAAAPPVRNFAAALRQPGRVTLIAEVKKASPSRGVLLANFDALALAACYAANGAAAISVLTDQRYFQGSLKYLEGIRLAQGHGRWTMDDGPLASNHAAISQVADARAASITSSSMVDRPSSRREPPLLRKDFIVDSYQVYEARAYGADALLLIVAALDDAALGALLAHTRELGMHALVEVHDAAELARALAAGAEIIGVNNRNLHTFETTLATTEALAAHLPQHNRPVLVSESGIFTPADVARVAACGADAVLIGEALVTAPDIAAKVRELAHVVTTEVFQ